MSEDIKKRNEDIRFLRKNRYTLKAIGSKHNLSHERIRQICEDIDIDAEPVEKVT